MAPRVGIVCGLAMERDALGRTILADPAILTAVSGARPGRAAEAAAAMAEAGCRRLVSLGLAGGLDPALATGTLLVPETVATLAGEVLPLDPAAVAGLAGARCGGRLLGVDRVILDPAEKRRLAACHGATALDMETHAVARVGAARCVPVTALRAIGDAAGTALPAAAAEAVGEDGRPRIGRVLAGLARRPGDLPALLRAGRDSRHALAALSAAAPALHAALLRAE